MKEKEMTYPKFQKYAMQILKNAVFNVQPQMLSQL